MITKGMLLKRNNLKIIKKLLSIKTTALTLVLMGCFLPLSLMGGEGGMLKPSIPFLFVKTIEMVIKSSTVLK